MHVAFLGAPAMDYEEVPPPPALAPWVAVFWRMRANRPFELRVLPDGCMDIIGTDVVGSLTKPIMVPFAAGETAAGVRFHPGGLPALLRCPASDLIDQRIPIAELVPRTAALGQLASGADEPDPLARAAYAVPTLSRLRRVAGYSERQIRRRVLAATGHSPKRLMRIGRMQRLLLGGRGESWARAAADHGFFDEAHMVNDVRELAGATPQALAAGMADSSKAISGRRS